MSPLEDLNLKLAYDRIKLDRPDRCFVTHPFLFQWIETDLQGWLEIIKQELASGYKPQDGLPCYVPKPGWLLRPGAILDLKDEVVFNAIIGSFLGVVFKEIKWAQGDPDVSYQLRKDALQPQWIRSGFPVWNEFRTKSLELLGKNIKFVLVADIAGFYENLDFPRLQSDLNGLGVDQKKLELLMQCLRRWANPRAKGIPQGYSGSDILAKLYLNPVDQGLRHAGFTHLRYVDDIRVFCKNKLEAKKALLKLNELLRNRGLNLQSAKTMILPANDAKRKIDGVEPVLKNIQLQLRKELRKVYEEAGPYTTTAEIDKILESHADEPLPEALEKAFKTYFLRSGNKDFNKTLFHYLLNRLGKTGSRIAVKVCLRMLKERPEETSEILKYLEAIELKKEEILKIVDYTKSEEAIYDYQLYQIGRWFFGREKILEEYTKLCRGWAFDKNRSPWLRSYSIAILARMGGPSDFEMLETAYGSVSTGIEQSDIVIGLERLEPIRRNSFYSKVQNDGELVRRAVVFTKGQARK